jgi:choline dehydrogenase-like flavoprotein
VIIGGGPAGNTAATHAARLGAEVTLIERDVIGGAAHLWDCIPSKTMIATGGAIAFTRRLEGMGLEQQAPEVDVDALTERIESIKMRLQRSTTNLLTSQGVTLVHGSARVVGPHEVEVTTTDEAGRAARRSSPPTRSSSPPAPARASPSGATRMASASSSPATATRRRCSRRASPSSVPASPVWSSSTCSARSAPR